MSGDYKFNKATLMSAPLLPVPAGDVRAAALTVTDRLSALVGADHEAIGEVLSMLGIDSESLSRGMFGAAEDVAS